MSFVSRDENKQKNARLLNWTFFFFRRKNASL